MNIGARCDLEAAKSSSASIARRVSSGGYGRKDSAATCCVRTARRHGLIRLPVRSASACNRSAAWGAAHQIPGQVSRGRGFVTGDDQREHLIPIQSFPTWVHRFPVAVIMNMLKKSNAPRMRRLSINSRRSRPNISIERKLNRDWTVWPPPQRIDAHLPFQSPGRAEYGLQHDLERQFAGVLG